MNIPRRILPVIVIAQFCCTSLWFAGNAVIGDLVKDYNLSDSALANLTSAVQFGFISGTLLFAMLMISDRFSPSRVFFFSAIIASVFNLGMIYEGNNFTSLLILRFLTGFFLAGIYPVGMKIAADYYKEGLGKSLGYLVGALVLGTAFPHLLKGASGTIPWEYVIIMTSSLSILGGLLISFFVPDGSLRKKSSRLNLLEFLKVFKNKNFRSAAFGYFGHMWELYAFWTFVPVIFLSYQELHPGELFNIPVFSFIIIGLGGIACVIGGYISLNLGAKKTAAIALSLSCACCLVSPVLFFINSSTVLIVFLIFWGMVVVADSPLFSSLVANNTVSESKGTALTIVNSIGFSITIISIQLISFLQNHINPKFIYIFLAVGPAFGLIALFDMREK